MDPGLAIAIVFALAFATTNGLHDASNAIATLVATRAATPLQAIVMASIFNLVGGSWMYFYGLGVVLEVIVLAVILRFAWTWPRTSSPSMPEPAAPHRPQLRMGR